VFAHCRERLARTAGPRTRHQERKGPRAGLRHLSHNFERGFAPGLSAKSLGTVLVLLAASLGTAAQSSVSPEYRVKANFLAMVPSFVDWPVDAFSSAQAPFVICVLGEFSFGISLARAVQDVTPHGRRVEIQQKHKDQELHSCHVLFVSHSEGKRYEKVLQSVQGADVLTVGETPDFLSAGGALSFSFQHEALQFEVNLLAANSAHLKVSSRLLALARRVLNSPEAAKA
jgi:uncharacterized protein DUF4154